MAFRFESLETFHLALDFAAAAYDKTKALNIAEGSGRGTARDFAHFLDIAIGSTFEVVTCFFLARKHGYIAIQELGDIKKAGELLSKKINAFKNTLGR
jgi:four helix bundle protein